MDAKRSSSFHTSKYSPQSMWDTKPEVKKAAYTTMEKDIERFIPELIKCITNPENVPKTVHLLGATT